MLFNSAIFPVIHVCELKYNRNFIITLFIHLMKDVACWSNTKWTSWYSLKIAELALNNNHSLTIYSTLKDILWWITFRDGLPVMSDLESDRCLLIAHLLCEYLIVAKLGGRKFVPEGDKAMTYMYLFLYLFNHTLQFQFNNFRQIKK